MQPRTYQDERFSYVAIARCAVGGIGWLSCTELEPGRLQLMRADGCHVHSLHMCCSKCILIRRGPRPEAHAAPQQPLVAGSFMPSMEDPQDFLHMPEHLQPRKVSWVGCQVGLGGMPGAHALPTAGARSQLTLGVPACPGSSSSSTRSKMHHLC